MIYDTMITNNISIIDSSGLSHLVLILEANDIIIINVMRTNIIRMPVISIMDCFP